MMRLFFALELPEETRSLLFDWVWQRHDGWAIDSESFLRKVPKENLHVTVKFLGEVAEEKLGAIRTVAAELPRIGSLELRSEKIGFFPPHGRARTFVAHFAADPERIAHFHDGLETAMERLGFAKETRPLRLHVTLARSKDRRGIPVAMTAPLRRDPALPGVSFQVDSLTLFKSDLGRQGSTYTVIERFPLE